MTTTATIAHYIKEIGRGKDGARPLTRQQSNELFGLVLDGQVSDLEIGAFCIAMRIKGETCEELLGFIDAAKARINSAALTPLHSPYLQQGWVVIPSYNGARKIPLLTPLLALLLAREGAYSLVHGLDEGLKAVSGVQRVTFLEILNRLRSMHHKDIAPLCERVHYSSIADLCLPLKKLLDVRKIIGLRNSAHSVVKLINPFLNDPQRNSVLVTSYTHPEYAVSMQQVLTEQKACALLLRGTEGEAVADPRRMPAMTALQHGQTLFSLESQQGSVEPLTSMPISIDADVSAAYIRSVIEGKIPVPAPIANQVQQILKLL